LRTALLALPELALGQSIANSFSVWLGGATDEFEETL
jgi:hypothetical protein